MKKTYFVIFACLAGVIILPADASTLIESTDGTGTHVSILIGDGMARIDSSDMEGYMIINMVKDTIYAISNDNHEVIDLSSPLDSNSTPDTAKINELKLPKTTFIRQEDGAEIAGYATKHYKVMVGDTFCFNEYLAKAMIDNPDIHQFIEVMAKQSQAQENKGMVEYSAADDPCESADEGMDEQYLTLGVPLRTLKPDGVSIHEVLRVQNDPAISSDTFKLPEKYKLVTREELMQRMIKQIQTEGGGAMQGNPHEHIDKNTPEINQEIPSEPE